MATEQVSTYRQPSEGQDNNASEVAVVHHKKNIYPTVRHMILVVAVLLTICIIAFLIHQNGKSIYDNGL
jgi:hypothetical protein